MNCFLLTYATNTIVWDHFVKSKDLHQTVHKSEVEFIVPVKTTAYRYGYVVFFENKFFTIKFELHPAIQTIGAL